MSRNQIDISRLNNAIVRDGKEFNRVMSALIEASGQDISQQIRGLGLEMYGQLVEKCPKDTARAASGFNISPEPSEWVPPEGDHNDALNQHVIDNTTKGSTIPIDEAMAISNNVNYLPMLENGHSAQAPSGFIALTIRNITAKLNNEIVPKQNKKKYG